MRRTLAVLFLATTGTLATTAPAAAAIEPPVCTTRPTGLQQIEGSCTNASRIWGYRIEIYCTYDPTGGLPEYTVWSDWRVTTEPITLACSPDGSYGYYAGGSGVQIRFQAPIKG
ncbi:hypothetical protein AB0M02_38425 [Actinoplanes sp. NPDC051861]|uniref:hypothetical protein n=1 Tax=Actinoplanes sp. NPDC051861 TaxID=3155170 RepID=UPI0034374FDA